MARGRVRILTQGRERPLRDLIDEAAMEIVLTEARRKLAQLFAIEGDPMSTAARVERLFYALECGMPVDEACEIFLSIPRWALSAWFEAHPEAAHLIEQFSGRIAAEQYRKIVTGGPKEALEWLRANRPDRWARSTRVTIDDVRDAIESATDAELLDLARSDTPARES